MSRLRSEFARLYLCGDLPPADGTASAGPTEPAPGLVDGRGRTRALVLELAAPADWQRLRPLWQGVQADLGWPAPAIAVSGSDGLQLWFSADAPVSAEAARLWLQALARRYLPGVAPHRLRLYPEAPPPADPQEAPRHAAEVPGVQADGQRWSAFVAPDLVPLFDDTPWLDSEPGHDGQAALLERLAVMKPGWYDTLMASDGSTANPELASPKSSAPAQPGQGPGHGGADACAGARIGARIGAGVGVGIGTGWVGGIADQAAAFLRQVMLDESAPLAVRVEAAKALLKYVPTSTDM